MTSVEISLPDKEEDVPHFLDQINPKSSSAYRGNSLLKRAGEKFEWSPEMVEEWIKCSEDPIYFIEKYVIIIHLDKGRMPFILRDYQREMVNLMHLNRRTIIATARQVGKSTTTCAFVLWYILFHKDKMVALLANKGETAREILGRIRLAYSLLPKWIQSGITEGGWNKGSINLENGSSIIAMATSSDAIRGYAINLLFLDEVAHVEGWELFEASVLPTISSSETSKIIMVSTPLGMNHFNRYWVLANKGRQDKDWNGYNPIKVSWEQVPGRDKKWYHETINSMSGNIDKFNQEYGVEFLGSSDTLIAGWKLKQLVHKTPVHYDAGLSQYYMPEKNRTYMLVADVSHGKAFDDSAFHVFDISEMPYRIACTFKSNMMVPYEFTEILQRTAQTYNKAYVLVENNDIGSTVTQLLQTEFAYDNLLYTRHGGRNGKTLSGGFAEGSDVGVNTTKILKIIGCSHCKLLIEQDQLIVEDFHTIEELSTFIRKGPSYAADDGKKDDLVMCLVLFAWATDQPYFKELSNINTIQHLRDATDEEIDNILLPFGIVDNAAFEANMIEDQKKDYGTDYSFNEEWQKGYNDYLNEEGTPLNF